MGIVRPAVRAGHGGMGGRRTGSRPLPKPGRERWFNAPHEFNQVMQEDALKMLDGQLKPGSKN